MSWFHAPIDGTAVIDGEGRGAVARRAVHLAAEDHPAVGAPRRNPPENVAMSRPWSASGTSGGRSHGAPGIQRPGNWRKATTCGSNHATATTEELWIASGLVLAT